MALPQAQPSRHQGGATMAKNQGNHVQLGQYLPHVRYEWNMLARTRNCLQGKHDPVVRNALIESFCIHARNLIEFYRNKKGYLNAKDFTGGSYKAKFVAPTSGEIGTKLYAKLNQHVAHLTRDRTADPDMKVTSNDRETIFEALRKEQERFEPLIQVQSTSSVQVSTDPSATNAIETASVAPLDG